MLSRYKSQSNLKTALWGCIRNDSQSRLLYNLLVRLVQRFSHISIEKAVIRMMDAHAVTAISP